MFAKIFQQIFDSSIREKPDVRFTFMDLLVLADAQGIVDMTHEAIAARTNRPLPVIRLTIAELESPDPKSRTPDDDGRRIRRLDEHRDWGWLIVNYEQFRKIASDEQRRARNLSAVHAYRSRRKLSSPVINGHRPSSLSCQAEGEGEAEAEAEASTKTTKLPRKPAKSTKRDVAWTEEMTDLVRRFEGALGAEWENDRQKWMTRIRHETGKSTRIIAEIESAILEDRIKTSTAGFAQDLWPRFV